MKKIICFVLVACMLMIGSGAVFAYGYDDDSAYHDHSGTQWSAYLDIEYNEYYDSNCFAYTSAQGALCQITLYMYDGNANCVGYDYASSYNSASAYIECETPETINGSATSYHTTSLSGDVWNVELNVVSYEEW